MNYITEIFSYPFVTRAFIVGTFVCVSAALLGVVLVLKRYSLIGHGLADVGFASLSVAVGFSFSPLIFSIPVVIVTSFFIMYMSQNKKINGDVAIGIFSTGALCFGVIVTSLTKGLNTDIYNYMFGSILAITKEDVFLSVVLSSIIIAIFILFYNRFFLITSDETFAKSCGINISFYQMLISILTAVTVVLGMRMMGTLLISSLIIFPAVIAKRFARSFKGLAVISCLSSLFCFTAGLFLSFYLNIPTGATVVAVNLFLLCIVSFLQLLKKG